MKFQFRNVLLHSVVIITCFLLLSLWGFYWAIRPYRFISSITPANFNLPYENISFHTKDNILIRGWFIPNSNPHAKTIILLHGYPADKGDILPSRIFLHEKYHLLFIDFRYFGKSEGKFSTVGKNEVLDVLAAIEFLNQRGLHEIGIWGFSLGGAVALMTAPNVPEIKAMVIESSFANLVMLSYDYFKIPLLKYPLGMMLRFWAWIFLGYDLKTVSPATSAASLKIPILLIHSKKDDVISIEHGELLKKSLQNNPQAEIVFFNGGHHGEAPPNYQKIVADFFAKYLY